MTTQVIRDTAGVITTGKFCLFGGSKSVSSGGEIPSNEMYFSTTAGSLSYKGSVGDVITLSDSNTFTVIDDNANTYTVSSGKHKVKLVESIDRDNFVSIGGEALVELHNFPTLSTITTFNFSAHDYNDAINLTKVPEFFPSNIIDITGLFAYTENFNQDIRMWDVSNVKIFDYAFSNAYLFNQPLNSWNTISATSMSDMFYKAIAFDQPLNSWDVSNVTNIGGMFYDASVFNQDISSWNVSNVTNMAGMFNNADAFNQPLNNWDTSNVTEMADMFRDAATFNSDLSGWDVSNVTNMYGMFYDATAFNQDLSQWCVSNITSKPDYFNDGAPLFTTDKHPVWGTCPV